MDFAEKLKELRAQAGVSQSELAARSGMSLSAVHDYEQGKREPSLRSAIKLAHALGTDCRAFADVMNDDPAQAPVNPGRPPKPAGSPKKTAPPVEAPPSAKKPGGRPRSKKGPR